MSKRYAVLGLSVVLALALAVPALGGPTNPIASISANDEIKKVQGEAKNAQTSANAAKTAATNAQNAANAANANANTRIKETIQVSEFVPESNSTPKFTSVSCPSGDPVLGGGFSVGGESNKVTVTASEEQLYGGGWFADASTINGQGAPSWSLVVFAVCGTK